MTVPATRQGAGWSVVNGRPVASTKQLTKVVIDYRRQARRRLADQIWIIEDELCRLLAVNLPLQARLTRCLGQSVYGREDKERLREVIADTRPRAFVLRQRAGETVIARRPFWSYAATASGIDELHDALGSQCECIREGEASAFDLLVERLMALRQRRRYYRGMISYGVDPELLVASYPAEAWLDACLLPDDIETAVERLAKEIAWSSQPTGDTAKRLFARRCFDQLSEEGDDTAYAQLLGEDDRLLWETTGAACAFGWRRLITMVGGFPDNTETLDDDWLAPVIPLVPRRDLRTMALAR